MAHEIRDISSHGVYVLTEQRWYPGTLVMLSLQREDVPEANPDRCIVMSAKVVRSGPDGVGFSFVMPEEPAPIVTRDTTPGADKKSLGRFLNRLKASCGQALIEYILMLPLIFLLIVNLVNFGGFFFAWIGVANAARAAADYTVLGGVSAGSLATATASQITAVITKDLSSLPNNPSATVNICENNSGTIKTVSGTCSATGAPSDPEPNNYVLAWVDVTYTYVPFIPAGFKFPNLNIYATIPPTTIHRRAVMRLIQ